jgi:hypothetical protein
MPDGYRLDLGGMGRLIDQLTEALCGPSNA